MTSAETTTPALTGVWAADTVHSDVSFKVRHMGVGKAKGTFVLTSSTLTFGPAGGLASGSVVASIDASSIETKNEQRNGHVRSADFLDVENHPTIEFTSTGVRDVQEDSFVLVGDLSVRGVTKSVELEVEYLGATVDAYGKDRLGFSATTTINRKDYGVNFSAVFGVSNSVVADKVELSLDLEYVRTGD